MFFGVLFLYFLFFRLFASPTVLISHVDYSDFSSRFFIFYFCTVVLIWHYLVSHSMWDFFCIYNNSILFSFCPEHAYISQIAFKRFLWTRAMLILYIYFLHLVFDCLQFSAVFYEHSRTDKKKTTQPNIYRK